MRATTRDLVEHPLLIGGRRPLPADVDVGEQRRALRVGPESLLRHAAEVPGRQAEREQRRATTDEHLATLGIGHIQATVGIGVQGQPRPAYAKPPRLGVVHRRRLRGGVNERGSDLVR
jgi:hypothetical protein